MFEQVSVKIEDRLAHMAVPNNSVQRDDMEHTAGARGEPAGEDQQIERDAKLVQLETEIQAAGQNQDEDQFIDLWLKLVDHARDEVLQDKKFWAFLNGYLNLKMSQLLQN